MSKFFSNFSPPSYANSHDFGDFSGCLNFLQEDIQGKFCLVQFSANSPDIKFVPPDFKLFNYGWKDFKKRFSGAICIPSICDENFVPKLMEKIFNGTNFTLANDYDQKDYCQMKKTFEWTPAGIFGILILSIFITLMILGSFFGSKFNLEAFSVKKNFLALFQLPKDDSIGYLRGHKSLINIFIIYFHIQLTKYFMPYKNSKSVLELENGLISLKYTALTAPAGNSLFVIISTIITTRITIDLVRK